MARRVRRYIDRPNVPGDANWRHDYHDPTTGQFAPLGYVSPSTLKRLLSSDPFDRMQAEWAIRSKLDDDPEAVEWITEFRSTRGAKRAMIARRIRHEVIGPRPRGTTDSDRRDQSAWDRASDVLARTLADQNRDAPEPDTHLTREPIPAGEWDTPDGYAYLEWDELLDGGGRGWALRGTDVDEEDGDLAHDADPAEVAAELASRAGIELRDQTIPPNEHALEVLRSLEAHQARDERRQVGERRRGLTRYGGSTSIPFDDMAFEDEDRDLYGTPADGPDDLPTPGDDELAMGPPPEPIRVSLEDPSVNVDAAAAELSAENPGTNILVISGGFNPILVGRDSLTGEVIDSSTRDYYWRDGERRDFTEAQRDRAARFAKQQDEKDMVGYGDGAATIERQRRAAARRRTKPAAEFPVRAGRTIDGRNWKKVGDNEWRSPVPESLEEFSALPDVDTGRRDRLGRPIMEPPDFDLEYETVTDADIDEMRGLDGVAMGPPVESDTDLGDPPGQVLPPSAPRPSVLPPEEWVELDRGLAERLFNHDLGNGYRSEIRDARPLDFPAVDSEGYAIAPVWATHGVILGPDGEVVGNFSRGLYADGRIDHSHLRIEDDHRGKGLGTTFAARSITAGQEAGFRRSTALGISSAISNGGYTWARAGFDWSGPTARDHLRDALRQQRTDIPDADWGALEPLLDGSPSPQDFAMAGWTPGAEDWPGRRFMSGDYGDLSFRAAYNYPDGLDGVAMGPPDRDDTVSVLRGYAVTEAIPYTTDGFTDTRTLQPAAFRTEAEARAYAADSPHAIVLPVYGHIASRRVGDPDAPGSGEVIEDLWDEPPTARAPSPTPQVEVDFPPQRELVHHPTGPSNEDLGNLDPASVAAGPPVDPQGLDTADVLGLTDPVLGLSDRSAPGPGESTDIRLDADLARTLFDVDLGDGYTANVEYVNHPAARAPGPDDATEITPDSSTLDTTALRVDGTIRNADGDVVGSFQRTMHSDGYITSDTLRIDPDAPDHIASRFTSSTWAAAELEGFRGFQVTATSDGRGGTGAYDWARIGMDWATEWDRRHVAQEIRRRLFEEDHDLDSGDTETLRRLADDLRWDDDEIRPNDVAMLGWSSGDDTWLGKQLLAGELLGPIEWNGEYRFAAVDEAFGDPRTTALVLTEDEWDQRGGGPRPAWLEDPHGRPPATIVSGDELRPGMVLVDNDGAPSGIVREHRDRPTGGHMVESLVDGEWHSVATPPSSTFEVVAGGTDLNPINEDLPTDDTGHLADDFLLEQPFLRSDGIDTPRPSATWRRACTRCGGDGVAGWGPDAGRCWRCLGDGSDPLAGRGWMFPADWDLATARTWMVDQVERLERDREAVARADTQWAENVATTPILAEVAESAAAYRASRRTSIGELPTWAHLDPVDRTLLDAARERPLTDGDVTRLRNAWRNAEDRRAAAAAARPAWIGRTGGRLRQHPATVTATRDLDAGGVELDLTDRDGNNIRVTTTKRWGFNANPGDELVLTGTIRSHDDGPVTTLSWVEAHPRDDGLAAAPLERAASLDLTYPGVAEDAARRMFNTDLGGGASSRVRSVIADTFGDGRVDVAGGVFTPDSDGAAGTFQLSLERDGTAHITEVWMEPEYQGRGYGTTLADTILTSIRNEGYDSVTFTAEATDGPDSANGAYTWARAGYDWESRDAARRFADNLRDLDLPSEAAPVVDVLERLEDALEAGDPLPTPAEFATAGMDGSANWPGRDVMTGTYGKVEWDGVIDLTTPLSETPTGDFDATHARTWTTTPDGRRRQVIVDWAAVPGGDVRAEG